LTRVKNFPTSPPGTSASSRHIDRLSIDENKSRNVDLLFELARFGCCHIRGRYIENYGTAKARPFDEHSFLVRGMIWIAAT